MVALAILRQKPLSLGEHTSPVITLTQRDVDIYRAFVAKDGSVAPVAAGEKISEYQALQAILLPSANNVADSVAIWAFGSVENYVTYANQLAEALDLTATHIADPSGYSPETVSSAQDLITLTIVAMKNPVFREIVRQPAANIPVAGTIHNVNRILGRDGVIGVKTGNTDEAGGVFVGATDYKVGPRTITVVTAIMGAPHLVMAMNDTLPLLASAKKQFVSTVVVPAASEVGAYHVPWSNPVRLATDSDIRIVRWRGNAVNVSAAFDSSHAPIAAGGNVGSVTVTSNGVNSISQVVTESAIPTPDIWWRLTHAL
jgi:D-alanyl-D-alanine carboxypeptidase (penicillin-binding protein 5/6)